ncbi:hypothetical protein GIB67_002237 [Kingdonia uniflora]|uniref:Uncharacterized protein n=1 Tax=Kingdonia uniflora TaxID=39325 RepID=A0A7J7KWV2_9MAGN|nr:hypothetical protein GIB67_002237 [Kingdonia uniflora]
MPGFRGTRDPECSVTRSRSGMKKKRVEFEDVQPQFIPNPTQENFPRRCITQLQDGVSHIYYIRNELTNRDSMRVHGTFTTVIKVWKEISTILPVRDAVVNIFRQFIDICLGNSDNRIIQALTERCHIKSGNVSILHLRTYLTVADDRKDDITIVRAFILFMMGHLKFQMANDTVPLGYLTAVANLTRLPNMTGALLFLLPCTMVLIPQSRLGVPSLDLSNFLRIGSTSIVGLATLLSKKMLSSRPIRVSEHGRGGIGGKQITRQAIYLF